MAAKGQGREAARLLRSELGLGTGYVDIYQVIRKLGIELYTRPFRDGLDGACKRQRGRDFIFVTRPRPRRCVTGSPRRLNSVTPNSAR